MAEHLTIPGALEWDAVERHSIATLRYAGGKEHDVKYVSEVAYDAALSREAALIGHLDAALRQVKANWDYANDNQQRLTVTKELLKRSLEYGGMTPDWRESVEAALKP